MQVSGTSWDCLLIEDAEKSQITHINTLVAAAMQLSVLFAPISAILFSHLTLVPAIRILYLNAFVVMTLKVVILYTASHETKMGVIRLEESRGKSIFSLAAGYGGVLKIISKSPGTIFALAITTLVGIVTMINTTFWQVIVSKKLLVPDYILPVFPIVRSAVAIVFLFLVAPHLTKGLLKMPLLIGFACYLTGQTILILAPVEGPVKYAMICVSLLFDGFAASYLFMLGKSLIALHIHREERARVQAIMNLIIMAATAPFGWIGGMLSGFSRSLPFVLNLFLIITGICVTLVFYMKYPRADEQHGG
jgi:hypothetical protein